MKANVILVLPLEVAHSLMSVQTKVTQWVEDLELIAAQKVAITYPSDAYTAFMHGLPVMRMIPSLSNLFVHWTLAT